ncbi:MULTISPECIES: Stk1 family PASTA domain-containing Ser/Thr kinase [Sutcliffiella]|uniref:Serine/threonine-protein kinase PrkC n=1 Tax=Sutcliffiella cohnii TaxID=33932 RepID=A0A223KRJ3_9BACI|nr:MULTISPECIES: Stk1 family PASTA domain-containing Ser/Thr kinase [Sutcliffiella]AST92100.1 serine/threonine protein kinase [Sutcliffiella cohnii]MED4015385.1 Stk1 family PASTA domain-containing Ser/Thr kinase [Sutcliffiella cohnii]WBL13331.1 Stk1 family PASTA domain-containing Ser/Thr kinase [Sutcliffiella sp. NC1]
MLIGKRLNGRYKIEQVIGGGGMANVYLAHDMILNRDVAVKVLRLDYANDNDFIRRFRREAQSATSLDHPNIVSIYDIGEENDIYYIVMEYVKGQTLKQYIQQNAPVAFNKVVEIMDQLTSAIAHAHDNGIIHRDIKPQNILIDTEGNIKVTDFGIAMALSSTTITQTNSLLGSVHYLSPEQARGGIATKKSDVYAIGIVMFEMLTGSLPFSGESAVSIALKHLQSDTPSPKRWNPTIPQSLENIVLKSMAKDPLYRYESVDEMNDDISTALEPHRRNEQPFSIPDEDEEATKAIPIIKGAALSSANLKNEDTIPPTSEQKEKKEKKKDAPPNKKKSKKKKWLIVLFTLLFLLVAGGIFAFTVLPSLLIPEEVEVPDVVNYEYDDAVEHLLSLGFEINEPIDETSDDIQEGNVTRTNPVAGRRVKEGSPITIYRSIGKETSEMDDYRTLSLEDAERRLKLKGLDNIEKVEEYSESVEAGIVMEQDPAPGTAIIPEETIVRLIVSKGSQPIKLTNYKGSTAEFAQNHLTDLGFSVKVDEEYSETVPEGNVIDQNPKPDTEVQKNSAVQLIVSKGPEPVDITVSITVNIPYSGEEEDQEQTVSIFIEDLNNTMESPVESFKITEDTNQEISLTIPYKGKASYKILVDETEVLSNTVDYDEMKDY